MTDENGLYYMSARYYNSISKRFLYYMWCNKSLGDRWRFWKIIMIEELFEMITGEHGLVVTLRCENRFDEKKYLDIKEMICDLVSDWKQQQTIPKKAMLGIIELLECLVGGSRFLSENEAIKVEDASIEIKDILNELYETL